MRPAKAWLVSGWELEKLQCVLRVPFFLLLGKKASIHCLEALLSARPSNCSYRISAQEFYKKAVWASSDDQASNQRFSMISASAPSSKFLIFVSFYPHCFWWWTVIQNTVSEINPSSPSCFWLWCFITATETLTKIVINEPISNSFKTLSMNCTSSFKYNLF